jgi:CheY-like chemotaxis protein/nitrogen-specific signal transduction histidine kinase
LGLICVAGAIITIFFYANRKLAAEVLQRKKAERSATAANRAKSVFLANMSHELRTPLNAILGYGQLLGQDSDLSGKYRKNIGTINRSATHLLRMIDEILEISKIESGRIMLNKKGFNLPSLVNTTLAMVRMRADQKGLDLAATVAADVPDLIFADEDKLHQILSNLLGNSIKYTEKGRIELKVNVTGDGDRHPDRLILQVTDTGLGIAPENIEKIFEPFFQQSDHTRSTDGTGLGLALVKQYVTAMEGSISVNSILGQGTTFQIDLPYESAQVAEIEERVPDHQVVIGLAADQPRYKILIVEDNPDSRSLLEQMLAQVGFTTKTAINGQEAVDIHAAWDPDLIWMDIRMPVMNGLEATRRIRERETGVDGSDGPEKTIIIALTASVFEDATEEIMTSGFDDFMRKPFTVAELFECMARHLNIQYIYRISRDTDTLAKTAEGAVELTANDLQGLSTEWLENMRQAVLRGRLRQMLALIEEIRQSHSRLADTLTNLVKNFRIEEILALLSRQ